MKLHLPKPLFTALLAAITLIAPAAWGANELNLGNAPGDFYAGNYAFSFQIDGNELDATEDTTDVLALYWGEFNGGNYYTNGITLTHANEGITLYVGDGFRANAGANNDRAEITESTTFTGSRGATFTSTLEVGATYTLVNKGANGSQIVMLLKNGEYLEEVDYNGNMYGGGAGSTMYSVWNDDYAPGNVLVWNGTSNSSSFELSNFIGGNATLAESDLIFASGIDGVTKTVNVSGAIAAGSISIYDSYIFNATAATTLSTTEGLSIASGKTLTLQGATTTLSGSITNNGTLTASNVTLSGTVTNNGTLNLAGFTVAADTTASVTGTGTINLSGTITNEGTLNLAGFTVDTTASITGDGTTTLSGAVTVTNNGSLTLNNATLHSSVTNNGTLYLNGVLNISSLAGLEQSGEYSDDNNNGVFTGSFSVVTSGAGAVLNRGGSFGLQLNGSALDTSTDAAIYYTYDSSKGSIKIFETGNQTYWINTNAAYDANNEQMLKAESFTVAAGAEFYLTDASVLSKTLIPTDTSKVYFRASGSETNLLRFTGASGGAGLSLTATVDTTNQKVTTGNSASSYAGNIIVLEGTTLELGATQAVAVAGKTYDADRNRFITVERGATLDVKGNEAYYHVVLEDGATLTNSGNTAVDKGWKALPYVELQGDATINSSSQMVMQKGGSDNNPNNPGTFQLALNGHKLTKTGTNMLYLQNVSIGSGTLQIDAGTVQTADGVTLVSGAALDVIINDGILHTLASLSLNTLTLGANADEVCVDSGITLTVTGATSAAGKFSKTGAGTLTLQGATNFGGEVYVTNGRLKVTGALTAGAINKTGSGTLELADGIGGRKINGTSSITGGILAITEEDAIDYGAETSMSISGATLQLDARQTVDGANSFELNSGTISGNGGANSMMNDVKVGLEVYDGSTLLISSEGTSSITTNIGFRDPAGKVEYTVTSGTLTNSGIIASHNNGTTGAVVKKGAGELILSGANTYANGTTVEAGTLTVNHANALGTGSVILGANSILTLGASVTNAIQVNGDGAEIKLSNNAALNHSTGVRTNNDTKVAYTVNSGSTLTISKEDGNTSNIESLNIAGGKVLLSAWNASLGSSADAVDMTLSNDGMFSFTNGNSANINGGKMYLNVEVDGSGKLAGSNWGNDSDIIGIITSNGAGDDDILQLGQYEDYTNWWTVSATIKDNENGTDKLKVQKVDDKEVVLNGVNTYSGGTEITGGTLTIKNIGALGSGKVTVSEAAKLKLDVGGTISFGSAEFVSGAGTVTIANGTTLQLSFEGGTPAVAGSTIDVTAGGTLLLDGKDRLGWESSDPGSPTTPTSAVILTGSKEGETITYAEMQLGDRQTHSAEISMNGYAKITAYNNADSAELNQFNKNGAIINVSGLDNTIAVNLGTRDALLLNVEEGGELLVSGKVYANGGGTHGTDEEKSYVTGSVVKQGAGLVEFSNAENTFEQKYVNEAGTTLISGTSSFAEGINVIDGTLKVSGTNNKVGTLKLGSAATITSQQGTDASMTKAAVNSSGISSTATDGTRGTLSNANVSIAQLAEDASFTIQDMALSNVKLSVTNAEGSDGEIIPVELRNVTAENTMLTGGEFTLHATPTPKVGSYDAETRTRTLIYSNGLGVSDGGFLMLNLDVINAVAPDQYGMYNIIITLTGFGDTLKELPVDDIMGLVIFDPNSWLGEALESTGQDIGVASLEAVEDEVVDQDFPTVNYSLGENVGTLVITIEGLNVPEPASATLGLAALMMLCARRRRKA